MPSEPSAMLVVEKGIPDLKVIPLERQVCVPGASTSADVLIDNSYVSRMHARIVVEAGGHGIRDLDRKNGAFVNGARQIVRHLPVSSDLSQPPIRFARDSTPAARIATSILMAATVRRR